MLGWMLKRGDNAPDTNAGDTTQLDQPDTPAPVFAARAFKSALFGTPAVSHEESQKTRDKVVTKGGTGPADSGSGTPSKLPGILLTPGTSTSRRKRVSFGRDVPGSSEVGKSNAMKSTTSNRRTTLSEALENSRKKSSELSEADVRRATAGSEDEWEEEDDDYCTNDITLDLNEPHSQSGRYWKGEFEKYHQEAKAEMEKLLKYKQLAKSYAQQKDAEAIQLAERLRDEQQRVINMEKRIADNASQIVSQKRQSADDEPTALLSKLAKQTSLAAQYRHRVQELEGELADFLRQKGEEGPGKGRRRRQVPPSPNTQKALLETQRELRRARSQLRELDMLREEISSLKARVKVAEGHTSRADVDDAASATGPRARELRAQLKKAEEESRKKDDEIRQLKSDFEAFRKENEAHEADTKAVLERAHTKIADLKKEVKSLRAADLDQSRPRSWKTRSEQPAETAETADNKPRDRSQAQRKLSFGDVKEARSSEAQSLRDRYQKADAAGQRGAPNVLTERPNLEKPKWQPFVPRSPRNRAYLGEALERRIRNGGATPAASKLKDPLRELPGQGRATRSSRSGRAGGKDEIDLLRNRFARLGGPESAGGDYISSSMVGNTSKSGTLPPERRAAALARIEKRMADKKRAQRRKATYDKENVRA
ncbi:hypothetical protein JDV02_004930 [Purpureocillium takamizusanense]|uniref:Spindle pole body-associated protein cut12 domain-containing protein n=1 Tax=Purpureocillium takamizusanense TaxID=2060973 RepID=A0A9Q8QGY4_9HYPO|nr:uncharacterized protein JDV02_004930 [Purpureocillium takamizusanense]UNI18676.1 hypothetical protein JDV02_004930 [Purpureocillium takamizusanense]